MAPVSLGMMAKNSDGWPKNMERSGKVVKVYRVADGASWAYSVNWYVGKKRYQKKFAHEEKALTFAKDQLGFLCLGGWDWIEKSHNDRDTITTAEKLLNPVGVGLIPALTEYVAAMEVMGDHGSLMQAATEFVERISQAEENKLVPEVVAELVAILEEELKIKPKRRRDVGTMRSHLRQFAKAIKKPVLEITLDDAVMWLQLSTVTDRSYNNKRTSLIRLGSFCKQRVTCLTTA